MIFVIIAGVRAAKPVPYDNGVVEAVFAGKNPTPALFLLHPISPAPETRNFSDALEQSCAADAAFLCTFVAHDNPFYQNLGSVLGYSGLVPELYLLSPDGSRYLFSGTPSKEALLAFRKQYQAGALQPLRRSQPGNVGVH
jgi:hypothetical protein